MFKYEKQEIKKVNTICPVCNCSNQNKDSWLTISGRFLNSEYVNDETYPIHKTCYFALMAVLSITTEK